MSYLFVDDPRARLQAAEDLLDDGTVLVGFDPSVTPAEQLRIMAAVNAREAGVLGVGAHLWRVPAGRVQQVVDVLMTVPARAPALLPAGEKSHCR